MPEALDKFRAKTQEPKPSGPGAYTKTILESSALKYAAVITEIVQQTNKPIAQVRIIVGGSKNRLLNQFTADATARRVLAGPVEATALGNLAMQILATGEASSLADARAMIDRSFPTEVFEPGESDRRSLTLLTRIRKLSVPSWRISMRNAHSRSDRFSRRTAPTPSCGC